MKKYSAVLFFVLTLFSCKDFLEEKQVNSLTQNVYATPAGLELLVNGTYQALRFKSDYNQGHYLFGIGSDVEVFGWTNADRVSMGSYAIDGWAQNAVGTRMTPMVTNLLGSRGGNITEGCYPIIGRCNIFFENYARLSAADQAKLSGRYGEMLFFRAYAYFMLTNVLGDAPMVTEAFEGMPTNFHFPRTPMQKIYLLMIEDLKKSLTLLPQTTASLGRITQPAAYHLLAKLHLVRAQGAQFENNPEPTLKKLFKGNVATDLDSAILNATAAINLVAPTNAAYGGLSPDFAALWKNERNDFSRDLQKEILLSAQYEPTQTFNGRYGNTLVHLFNSDHTTLRAATPRTMDYGRPYATAKPTDWGYDMYTDRANDSRYYKTYLYEYFSTDTRDVTKNGGKPWDAPTAFYFNQRLKAPGDPAVVVSTSSRLKSGNRSIVYIENSKDEPFDSLWVASQPFIMMVRWTVGSPANAGYFTYDADKNITGFKPGADVDPLNPIVTDRTGRKLIYRLSGDKGNQFGTNQGFGPSAWFMCPKKWADINRGKGVDPNGGGAIDVPLMRLAETYLIRAEAYGRKGDYGSAIADINVLRKRASFHPGENRPNVLMTLEPGALVGRFNVPAAEALPPFAVSTDSYSAIEVDGTEWQAGSPRAKLENYYPGAPNLFVEFIYNERARELIFELTNVEDLHNAGILYERIYYRDMMGAPASAAGTPDFPFPTDDISDGKIGATGKGMGNFSRMHTFKAWPQSFLDLLTDENGNPLTPDQIRDFQNYGY